MLNTTGKDIKIYLSVNIAQEKRSRENKLAKKLFSKERIIRLRHNGSSLLAGHYLGLH